MTAPETVSPADTAAFLRRHCPLEPVTGLILGTGLDGLADRVDVEASFAFEDLPGFRPATVSFHPGRFLLGRLGGTPVAALQGRFHFYEGVSLRQVGFPVRVFRALGCRTAVFTGAAGGLNPLYRRGDIVGVDDHINMLWLNPLIGPVDETEGPRFPDMSRPYDGALLDRAEKRAMELGRRLWRGVYAWVPGPCLETRAEYRLLRAAGADVVGMSMVPEVITAVWAGLRTAAFAVVTDMGLPDALEPIDVEKVVATAAEAGPALTELLLALVQEDACD